MLRYELTGYLRSQAPYALRLGPRSMATMTSSGTAFTVTPLPDCRTRDTSHHTDKGFCNPWPSYSSNPSLISLLQTRFGSNRNFVPVPPNRHGLVPVVKPGWGVGKEGLKATWIGHASWFLETSTQHGRDRGIRILVDPVWSERVSPVTFAGPKRFSPVPCALEDVPDVDLVVISHNHYDHLDLETIKNIFARRKGRVKFACALGLKRWFVGLGIGMEEDDVIELDWWQGVEVNVKDVGSIKLTCTPSQHISGRSIWDTGHTLWCSWVIEEISTGTAAAKKLYFAGDTAYRTVDTESLDEKDLASFPACPAFKEIGETFGPFDLALLPIGCYCPRAFMSKVHCSPEDSICIHKDLKSKKSIGMHYGTVRGGLSQYYEPVVDPPERWKVACHENGLKWGKEVGLCDIGGTVVV